MAIRVSTAPSEPVRAPAFKGRTGIGSWPCTGSHWTRRTVSARCPPGPCCGHIRIGPCSPVSLGLQAAANALARPGLLPEPQAEQILAGHRLALEGKGFVNAWGVAKGELTVRSGAYE